ncbi:MAG TPA: asparagine synthase (glutamine-hydrolyzing) [Tepidisphaeraceae bacterium]|nr:asparagine synthase (glutamine-hydrolyzing) [Tepidisphaeraceae bacterium]
MCGFAGVISWDQRYRVSREALAAMSARIAHRGPDGQGIYFSPDAPITPACPQVALAHRRLAILDPDPRADQPFADAAGRWLVFNGEIYNFRALRAELSKLNPNYPWRTDGDTEVLLAAYGQWGENCVEHFNGMFAFAIWDAPAQSLFLARDRMGQKPLYVAYLTREGLPAATLDSHDAPAAPAVVAFASEISALRALDWVDATLDVPQLALYLSVGYLADGSIYRGVRSLRPAGRLQIRSCQSGYYNQSYYFAAGPEGASLTDSDAVSETRRLLTTAVRRQLVSDVPLGCFLSGGIDSSIIAAAMREAGGQVHTFSIAFDDVRYDESKYARAVARHLGTKHEVFRVTPRVADDLPRLAEVFGEPFADSSAIPTHYLARETRRHVKVALSGDGGDELFGGYDRYRAMALGERIRRLPPPVRRLITSRLLQGIPATHPKSMIARLKRFTRSLHEPPDRRYAGYMRIFDGSTIDALLRPGLRDRSGNGDFLEEWYDIFLHRMDEVRAALSVDRLSYLPYDLLAKVDRASMLHALEVRSPFMDHELVQFAAGLTTEQLLKGGPKRMLRAAFAEDLPAWVFKRRKMGFAVPIGDWLRGELRTMLRDHLFAANSFASQHFNRAVVERLVEEHETFRRDHSQRLYALLMLELWWRGQRAS